jgi:hypothetical protein
MNKYEIFIEDGADLEYAGSDYACEICDKPINDTEQCFILSASADVQLPGRTTYKDSNMSSFMIRTCSIPCAEMAILQRV